MLFRQLFEPMSSTYTYLLACEKTGEAALIDPVFETVERDLDLVSGLGLKLASTLETHIHADHVTGAGRLRALSGSKAGFPAASGAEGVDFTISEGRPVRGYCAHCAGGTRVVWNSLLDLISEDEEPRQRSAPN